MTSKLVRDRIPEIIVAAGGRPVTHVADPPEYWLGLRTKLAEEVAEFLESETPEVLEVIEAICTVMRLSQVELQRIKEAKKADRGGFMKRLILESA